MPLRRLGRRLLWGLLAIALVGLCTRAVQLQQGAAQPVDGVLVLGGSIRREIHAAEMGRSSPPVPMLISQGSPDPCIRRVFEDSPRGLAGIWLEKCAHSTFDNFRYAIPLLTRWGVHHVRVVTSPSHLPRAQWMAQILLGGHGIWVEMDLVDEPGIPGNRESPLKTALDVTRSLIWVGVSQLYRPLCPRVVPLASVDLASWARRGYRCEHQAGLD